MARDEAQDQYTISQLVDVSGVSRRTVRYYVQEGLIPPPSGLGRGASYGREHLEKLLAVKSMQESGLTLDEIRLAIEPGRRNPGLVLRRVASLDRSHWTRVELAPGVELHVSSRNQVPPPSKLAELAEWCRIHLRPNRENEDA